MKLILLLDRLFHRIALCSGYFACVAMILLVANVFYDVIMRYLLNDVSIGMQELEWHLYALVFLFGIPYAMARDGHVRVDVLFVRWSDKTRAWINLLGVMFFILPFVALVTYYGYFFALESFNINEGSGDPGGLPYRWIIKSMIAIAFILIGLSGLGMITQALRVIIGGETYPEHTREHLS